MSDESFNVTPKVQYQMQMLGDNILAVYVRQFKILISCSTSAFWKLGSHFFNNHTNLYRDIKYRMNMPFCCL